MPNQSNVTVKKNDGITDVIYTAVIPSSGDKSPAIWKNQTLGTAAAHRPEMKLQSRDNGTGLARRLDGAFMYPSLTVGTDGKTNVGDKLVASISILVPKGMPDAEVSEGVSQFVNLCASAPFKEAFMQGYAHT